MAAIERGGGETFDLEMVAQLQQRGHEVHVLCGIPLAGRMKSKLIGLPCITLRTPYMGWLPWEKMKGGWRLRVADFWCFEQAAARWISNHQSEWDIIQICEMPHLVHLLKRKGVRTPVCMRLTAPHLYDPWGGTVQADAVIASGTTLRTLRNKLPVHIHDIPNGVDVNLFKPVHEKIGKEQRAKGKSLFVPIETIADYEGSSLRYESRGLRAKDGCACEESTKLATKLCRIGNLQPATCNLQPSDTPKQVRGSSSHHSSPITHLPFEVRDRVDRDVVGSPIPNQPISNSPISNQLIYVGRFQDVKNHAMLIRAMPKVLAQVPETRLVLAGSGPLRKAVEQQARQFDCLDRIEFLGEVMHRDLPDLYRASAMAILPSKYESFSFTTLEAMACGLPVVATDTEWVPGLLGRNMKDEKGSMKVEDLSVINHQSSISCLPGGMVTPLDNAATMAEAIVYLLKNPELREQMGRRNRETVVARYQWDASAEKLEDVYRQLTSKHRNRI